MGVSEEQIERYLNERGNQEDDEQANNNEFEYWPENETAINVFMRARRFWQRAGFSGLPHALDPVAVDLVMRRMGHQADMDLFEDVMTIGDGAVRAIGERFARG